MTAKRMLDAFSETLMQDDRILSPRERELLTSVLQNCKTVVGSNPEIQAAVSAVITRSVGETVAQRAFSLLGESIVEQILAPAGISRVSAERQQTAEMNSPQPPKPSPGPGPSSVPSPQPPTSSPQPPHPSDSPQPPHGSTRVRSYGISREKAQDSARSAGVTVLEHPEILRAKSVVLDEFLAPQELEELMSFALQHENHFETSEVISPSGEPGLVDYEHRRSRVLMDLGRHEELILARIRSVLPQVLEQLGMEEFPITRVEAQITASNDGDFFRAHADDSDASIASRRLTFVYFFHREPKQFDGGELRLHDARNAADRPTEGGTYQSISPRQNQIVFFPCSVLHEIMPVKCESEAFADSRFTLNGWLHR